MYSKGLPVRELYCKCKHCRTSYDLHEARDVALKKKTRVIRCPKCKKRVAISN